MQTVNFQCGHCGNLMAVGVEYLGQQVRCPHCHQVVVAPAGPTPTPTSSAPAPEPASVPVPAPWLPPEPAPSPPESVDPFPAIAQSEDIFHQPTEPQDALFGEEPPRLEIPREPPSSAPLPEPVFEKPPQEGIAPTFSPVPAASDEPSVVASAGENGTGGLPWLHGPTTSPAPESPTEPAPALPESMTQPRKPRTPESRVNWFIPLVFIPLVLYAVLATAVGGYLYIKLKTVPPHPFDMMPDIEGDTPGTRKPGGKSRLSFDRKFATRPMPNHLVTQLGKTIRIGDLEVTPKKVVRRKVALFAERAEEQAEPSPSDALVLVLHLKNVGNETFTPMDNYFDRNWKAGNDGSPPLTLLQAGKETFFGGPAKWFPRNHSRSKGERREWLEGRANVDTVGLGPGEEMDTIVATDGWDAAMAQYLFGTDGEGKQTRKGYQGPLVWRIQVRRGTVEWKGAQRSATGVIGVEFTDRDIERAPSKG